MSDFKIYSSRFFSCFKRMDNVNYNFDLAKHLILASISYKPDDDDYQREYFYKPAIIIMISIVECILYDFLIKIQTHTYEGVPNLTQKDLDSIREINIPNVLASFNEICKKHELLGKKNDPIYEIIRLFSNIRNRIHIQNTKREKPFDEFDLWTIPLVKECGKLLKDICGIMCDKYPRPKHMHVTYAIPRDVSFPEPWRNI